MPIKCIADAKYHVLWRPPECNVLIATQDLKDDPAIDIAANLLAEARNAEEKSVFRSRELVCGRTVIEGEHHRDSAHASFRFQGK